MNLNERPADRLFPLHAARRKSGVCPSCESGALAESDFRDALSFREAKISGLCQECQDAVFDDDDDPDLDPPLSRSDTLRLVGPPPPPPSPYCTDPDVCNPDFPDPLRSL